MKPLEAVLYLQQLEKYSVKEAKVIDLLNVDALQKPIAQAYFRELSPRGAYLFFDEDGHIRYIGQTNQNFYQRLLTQVDTTYYPGYGWNSMISIMTCNRTGKPHAEVTEEDHWDDYDEVCSFKLVLVDVGTHEEVNKDELKWLERILQKAFLRADGEKLMNNRIGGLAPHEWDLSIDQLIR